MRFLRSRLAPEMLPGSTGRSRERPFPCPHRSGKPSADPSQCQSGPTEEGSIFAPCRAKPRACTRLGAQGPSTPSSHEPLNIHHLSEGAPELSFPNKPQTTRNPRGMKDPARRRDQGRGLLSSEAQQLPIVVPQPASPAHAGLTPAPRPRGDYTA